MAFLIVEEHGQTRHVPLTGIKAVIGRAPDADIVISDDKSSRHHAVLEYEGDTYTLRDLKSLNGCFVDGMRVREHTLRFGDSFTIGNARFTLETETATAFDTR